MFGSDFITNPYRAYGHLRAAAPLHWADKFRSGAWLVTRYADVLAGLHDPRLSSQRQKFSEPEELEISRDEGMPLSFGHGTHFCIGAALAYTEAEIAFTTLLDRTSGMRLLEDVPAWRSNLSFRGLSRLPAVVVSAVVEM